MPREAADLQETRRSDAPLYLSSIIPAQPDEYLEYNFIRDSARNMETFFSAPAYYCHQPRQTTSVRPDEKSCSDYKEPETAPLLRSDPASKMYTDEGHATLASLSGTDSTAPTLPDLEAQAWATRRSRPIEAPQAPQHLSRYQTICWYFSNRPRDTAIALVALFIALMASFALLLLVFILFMQSTGRMGSVVRMVDAAMATAHKNVLDLLCVFAQPECEAQAVTAATA